MGKRILVKRSQPEQKSSVIVQLTANIRLNEGTIVAVGDVPNMYINDKVIFAPHTGQPIKTEDDKNEYLIFKDDEILAVVLST